MPGGRTHASVSRSYSHAAVRSPRLALIACMDRSEDLEKDEDRPDGGQRAAQAVAALYRGDEHAGRDREAGGQHAAQEEDRPPGQGQRAIGLRQDGEQLPGGSHAG